MSLNKFKIAVICIFAGFSQIVFSQVARPEHANFIDAKGHRQGIWRVFNPEGMSYFGQFKDNRPYGRFVHFDRLDSTKIITILDYFRDGYAAKVTHFHPNGEIRATGFYLDKIRDSTWEIYDTEGRIIERLNYLDGMRHGLSELFDKDGNLIERTEWYRGLRNGRWWQKTEHGEQWTTYKFNLSHGIYEAFFANGNHFIKGYYEEGLREGTWYFYHENGLLDRVMQFKNNQLLKKQIAINVAGKDILIDSDSVAYVHTNGRIVEIAMLDNTMYRPRQTFDQLLTSLDTDDFFLATPNFLAPFRLFDTLVMQPDEDIEDAQTLRPNNPDFDRAMLEAERRSKQRALLKLKIPTPYEIFVDGEVIGLLQSVTNNKPVIAD
jgi:antitoxin component YwqK of YwqJK toxin-antitoxin module